MKYSMNASVVALCREVFPDMSGVGARTWVNAAHATLKDKRKLTPVQLTGERAKKYEQLMAQIRADVLTR